MCLAAGIYYQETLLYLRRKDYNLTSRHGERLDTAELCDVMLSAGCWVPPKGVCSRSPLGKQRSEIAEVQCLPKEQKEKKKLPNLYRSLTASGSENHNRKPPGGGRPCL